MIEIAMHVLWFMLGAASAVIVWGFLTFWCAVKVVVGQRERN